MPRSKRLHLPRTTRRVTVITVLALAAALAPPATAGARPAPASAHQHDTGGKGAVGWDTYRHLDRLPELPAGSRTEQFSSFDRTGDNDDGFEGTYSCLRHEAGGCVIAEDTGPGEVGALWFTRDEGDVTKTGRITVELDGRKVLDAPLQDVVEGKLGAPFVSPLVADADQSSGGVYIEVPMPYRESMKITTEHNPLFHHVSYRSFADAEGVTAFDPSDPAEDVVETLRNAGTRDPKPALPGSRTERTDVRLAPGRSATLADTRTPGLLSRLLLDLPQARYVAPRTETDEGRAFGPDASTPNAPRGSSSFKVAVDPGNDGVRLTRRLDPAIGKQTADITVDGEPAGRWGPSKQAGGGMWSEESVELPAALTAGKSEITVKNEFVSSDLDFNEFTYQADSITADDQGRATEHKRTDTVDVGDPDDEKAHGYTITGQTWEGERTGSFPLDEQQKKQLAASQKMLSGLRLRITFDGERTVDAPVGEFFGAGQAVAPVRSLMYGIDAGPGTATRFSSWWPMPFERRATVRLFNGTDTAVDAGRAAVTSAPSGPQAAAVGAGDLGHFRATSNAGHTEDGESWSLLKAQGRGKFMGVTHSMAGRLDRNFLEGDERAYVDGSRSPAVHGTGTEDFYQSGWYFNRDTYTAPWNGNPNHSGPQTGCTDNEDCTGAYRQLIHDAVPFRTSLDYSIEHGPTNDVAGDYSSTAYWYGHPEKSAERTDTLTVGDDASEKAHHYTAEDPGGVETLASHFEGDFRSPQALTATTRATSSPVTFTLAVDPRNDGVELRRTSDQRAGGQRASVSVDGTAVHDWQQPLGNTTRRWLDDSYELPASLTKGKKEITVTIVPAKGEGVPDWSAGAYSAYSVRR